MFCHDVIDARPAVLDDEGREIEPAAEAVDRMGLRMDQVLAFMAGAS
jgi:hypothetical protein